MIQDIVEAIGETKSNLTLIRSKLDKGEVTKAKEIASKTVLSLLRIDQVELARNVGMIIKLVDQNDISRANVIAGEINDKVDRVIRSQGQFKLCRKCGWKNPSNTNFCTNCRNYIK